MDGAVSERAGNVNEITGLSARTRQLGAIATEPF